MMKKIILLFVVLLALPFYCYAQQTLKGDVNGDGLVNISDVTVLISGVLNDNYSNVIFANADVNSDDQVNITDVTMIISRVLNGNWPGNPTQGDYVDLGLPSGTLWATRNVGASSPEDYGDYFAWGETAPKDWYEWFTYLWYDDDGNPIKYTDFDNKTELDPADDAACAKYPNGRTPSIDQFDELIAQCSFQWTTMNDVPGALFTGPNGNTMFLPAAGFCTYGVSWGGLEAQYWSRTLYLTDTGNASECAYLLYFYMYIKEAYLSSAERACGRSIRAVRVSQN